MSDLSFEKGPTPQKFYEDRFALRRDAGRFFEKKLRKKLYYQKWLDFKAKIVLSFVALLPLIFWDRYPKNSTRLDLR